MKALRHSTMVQDSRGKMFCPVSPVDNPYVVREPLRKSPFWQDDEVLRDMDEKSEWALARELVSVGRHIQMLPQPAHLIGEAATDLHGVYVHI